MGHNFNGELAFVKPLTVPQLVTLNSILGEDSRDHPAWGVPSIIFIDLETSDDYSVLKWNGAEKTYNLDQAINIVVTEMRKSWPEFGLTGMLEALAVHGDSHERYEIVIGNDGIARKRYTK